MTGPNVSSNSSRFSSLRPTAILARVDRSEMEQAAVRVAVVAMIVAYLFHAATQDGSVDATEGVALGWAIAVLAFGLCLLLWISIVGGKSLIRRVLGMIVDNAATTACLVLMGEAGA